MTAISVPLWINFQRGRLHFGGTGGLVGDGLRASKRRGRGPIGWEDGARKCGGEELINTE